MSAYSPVIARPRRLGSTYGFGNVLIGLLFLASSVPSPLYELYQDRWHFSSLVLTEIFAIYSLTVAIALNVTGPLSDRYGRRRFAIAGLATVLASMVVFALARNIEWLFVARALQGAGVGTGSTALIAAVIELRPDEPSAGAVSASVSSNLGLGVGALGAGLAAAYTASPTILPFVSLAVLFLLALPACARLSDSRPSDNPLRRIHRLGLPRHSGWAFAVYSGGFFAAWSVAGLYMSLGPSIATLIAGVPSALSGGIVISALGFLGAFVTGALRRWTGRSQMLIGCPLLVTGLLLVVWACVVRSEGAFIGGSIVLACGWGLVNVGAFQSLVSLSDETNRAASLLVSQSDATGSATRRSDLVPWLP